MNILSILLTIGINIFLISSVAGNTSVKIKILATSDIHGNLINTDYYADRPTHKYGLVTLAGIIKKQRSLCPNTYLVDNGDLIQGGPTAQWAFSSFQKNPKFVNPIIYMLNALQYDVANIGNHEFNYGLKYLDHVTKEANFPFINANIRTDSKKGPGKNIYPPFIIINRKVTDNLGNIHPFKIGFIGLAPPQVMIWDSNKLKGKVAAFGIVSTLRSFIPKLKQSGVDLIVAVVHSGLNKPYEKIKDKRFKDEHSVYQVSRVSGVDAIVFGHDHTIFPANKSDSVSGIDYLKGLINNVIAVNPGSLAQSLGVIDLTVEKKTDGWQIIKKNASIILPAPLSKDAIAPLPTGIAKLDTYLKFVHLQTRKFLDRPIGKTLVPINTFFSLVTDSVAIQLINNAQTWYVKNRLGKSEFSSLPLLSASAPFRASFSKDFENYVDLKIGKLTRRSAFDLYKYSNTIAVVKVSGQQLREWLEHSAGIFNQIKLNQTKTQELINIQFPTYNFDIIDGINYEINLKYPLRYNMRGQLINPNSYRIQKLTYQGKTVDPKDQFLVITNNYRAAGGGYFPGLDGSNIVLKFETTNREALIQYVETFSPLSTKTDNNWQLIIPKVKSDILYWTSKKSIQNAPRNWKLHNVDSIGRAGFFLPTLAH